MAMGSKFRNFVSRLLAGAIADIAKSGLVVTLLSVLSLLVAVVSLQVAVAQLKAGQAAAPVVSQPCHAPPAPPSDLAEPRLTNRDCNCPGPHCLLNQGRGSVVLLSKGQAWRHPRDGTCINQEVDGLLWWQADPINAIRIGDMADGKPV